MQRITSTNGRPIYNLSSGKSLTQSVSEALQNRKSIKKDKRLQNHLELIHGFEFAANCEKVKISNDGSFVGACGMYPPEFKLFECAELGLKFCRRLDAEIVDFLFLSSDWKKIAFLLNDRTLEFHAQGGRHHRLRIPNFGRTLEYVPDTADLWVGGSSPSIHRFDLESGMFDTSIDVGSGMTIVNKIKCHSVLPALFLGGNNNGTLEVRDIRCPDKPVSSIQTIPDDEFGYGSKEVTALDFSKSGVQIVVGTSTGVCRVYDVRSSKPLFEHSHYTDNPIVDLQVCQSASQMTGSEMIVASADSQFVRLWSLDKQQDFSTSSIQYGSEEDSSSESHLLAAFESDAKINSLCVYPDSGLIMLARDHSRLGSYFVPALGIAPAWCSELDNITEEFEEKTVTVAAASATSDLVQRQVFEGLRFVTASQLAEMNGTHLIGTPLVKPYMHGYFMKDKLYSHMRAAASPFDIEAFKKRKIKEKLEAKRTMRVPVRQKKTKVNSILHEELQKIATAQPGSTTKQKKKTARAKAVLTDPRFSEMFTDPSFSIETI